MVTIDDDHEDTMPELPRFDDGMADVSELAGTPAESIVNEAMDAEADPGSEDGNRRNGHRERSLPTSVGTLTPRIPKPRRGSCFPEDVVDRYPRTDRAAVAAASEMVTRGISTRKSERIARTLGVDRLGKGCGLPYACHA